MKSQIPKALCQLAVSRRFLAIGAALLGAVAVARAQGNPIVVQTIADLRSYPVSGLTNNPPTVALVIDYYSPSDLIGQFTYATRGRGGGLFRWMSPTNTIPGLPFPHDDGGRWIVPNSPNQSAGVWERVLQGEPPNVRMWGAKADNATDDTRAIQNAVAACNYGWADELVFPAGGYIISNTIVFPYGLHIRGEAPSATWIIMGTNCQHDVFQTANASNALAGASYDFDHGVLIEDLTRMAVS